MRALAALLLSIAAFGPAPTPSARPPISERTASVPAPAVTQRAASATASPIIFSFDVENRSSMPVVVSVASDTAATMPGFEPGQRGTISIPLLNPENGINVEVQGAECRLLADQLYSTPVPFTLLVEDGAETETIRLSTRAGVSSNPVPLPSNSLVGCGG